MFMKNDFQNNLLYQKFSQRWTCFKKKWNWNTTDTSYCSLLDWNVTFIGLNMVCDCQTYISLSEWWDGIWQYGLRFAYLSQHFIFIYYIDCILHKWGFFGVPVVALWNYLWIRVLPFGMTSLCVWSKIKWQCQEFFKPPERKERKQLNL